MMGDSNGLWETRKMQSQAYLRKGLERGLDTRHMLSLNNPISVLGNQIEQCGFHSSLRPRDDNCACIGVHFIRIYNLQSMISSFTSITFSNCL
jgi:hypothetical protein